MAAASSLDSGINSESGEDENERSSASSHAAAFNSNTVNVEDVKFCVCNCTLDESNTDDDLTYFTGVHSVMERRHHENNMPLTEMTKNAVLFSGDCNFISNKLLSNIEREKFLKSKQETETTTPTIAAQHIGNAFDSTPAHFTCPATRKRLNTFDIDTFSPSNRQNAPPVRKSSLTENNSKQQLSAIECATGTDDTDCVWLLTHERTSVSPLNNSRNQSKNASNCSFHDKHREETASKISCTDTSSSSGIGLTSSDSTSASLLDNSSRTQSCSSHTESSHKPDVEMINCSIQSKGKNNGSLNPGSRTYLESSGREPAGSKPGLTCRQKVKPLTHKRQNIAAHFRFNCRPPKNDTSSSPNTPTYLESPTPSLNLPASASSNSLPDSEPTTADCNYGCASYDGAYGSGCITSLMSIDQAVPIGIRRRIGPKYKLITSGDLLVCRLNHTRTIISKIMNSKYLRRWEPHDIVLRDSCVTSNSPYGFMEMPICYSSIEDVNVVARWDSGQRFCVRLTVPEGSVLLQAANVYLRDQWLHSIQWMRHCYKYQGILCHTTRPEVLVREIKNLVCTALSTPIQDPSVSQFPLELVSALLQEHACTISKEAHESIIVTLAPLLENNNPTQEICQFFIKHCKDSPRSAIVIELFTPVVQRILKHNMDFGKAIQVRSFVQEYVHALNSQNDGRNVVRRFVKSMHGLTSTCPHPRVLPNLVAVCLAAIYSCFEEKKTVLNNNFNMSQAEIEDRLLCYLAMLDAIQSACRSSFDDWRPALGSLLQPIPFPDGALDDALFTEFLQPALVNLATDLRCEVHQTLLGIRDSKQGWFHLYCPGGNACSDEGELFGQMLCTLIRCCCRRKKFLQNTMRKLTGPCMLLALRDNEAAMEALCAMLEFEIISNEDYKMQIVTTLQSTTRGKQMYNEVCERQIALRELQQKGGPRKLTLPAKSTDADLAKLLKSGSFGNLECLSLAFTRVSSNCAHDLIKLPSLKYLNLWSTQFGDIGLLVISEHLHKLQVLNLCETPVTDKGLQYLFGMTSLRKLNLNSTHLSALMFEGLKERLPALQEVDVRYTEAW